jgi:hypothetical protein
MTQAYQGSSDFFISGDAYIVQTIYMPLQMTYRVHRLGAKPSRKLNLSVTDSTIESTIVSQTF